MTSIATALLAGIAMGLRHATDPDHVLAVTTMTTRQRNIRGAAWTGALWGIGHSATVLLVGGAIVLLGVTIPPQVALALELGVAVMLVVLGFANLRVHQHASEPQVEAPQSASPMARSPAQIARPIVVGSVHGLAGSAAVALLVLTTLATPAWGVVYLACFGLGTVIGMMALTAAVAVPLAHALPKSDQARRIVVRSAGALSIACGLFVGYQVGVVDGLFWDVALAASPP